MENLIEINQERFNNVIDLYWDWKRLNAGIKKFYPRGVNLHEAITETICCYVNNFKLSVGGGSEDAVNPSNNQLIQVKGSSNWDSDLTSFGPESKFDSLHFVRLKTDKDGNDKMYLYQIPTDNLDNIMVNKNNSVADFKAQGKRPRFSLIEKYIDPLKIKPYASVDLVNKSVTML